MLGTVMSTDNVSFFLHDVNNWYGRLLFQIREFQELERSGVIVLKWDLEPADLGMSSSSAT